MYTGSTAQKLQEDWLSARLNLGTFVTTMATFIRVLLWCTQDMVPADIFQRNGQLFKVQHASEETFVSTWLHNWAPDSNGDRITDFLGQPFMLNGKR